MSFLQRRVVRILAFCYGLVITKFKALDSVLSSASDDSWAGLAPEPFQPPSVPHNVPVPSGCVAPAPTSHVDLTWPSKLGQFPGLLDHPDAYKSQLPSSYDAQPFLVAGSESSFQEGSGQAGLCSPASGAPASDPDEFVLPQTLLGKRRRDEDGTLEDGSPEANNSQG
ncbi:hypothetical protein F5148DRAFT_527626 [Russula earlei]|uniref:Uncharacterized protein n=1 Tax=Russula earlei TaxID=71964 RepID=A0ACC0TWT8_9AGAM|nr:hypothetical protein F5148DRAFT_527626 [Russula earlei]